MRYRVSVSVFLAALFVSAFSHAETLRVSAEKASLRSGPTLQSDIVAMAVKGTLLGVLAKEGYWNKVEILSTGLVSTSDEWASKHVTFDAAGRFPLSASRIS